MTQPIAIAIRCIDCHQPTPLEDATPVESTEDGALYVCTPCLIAEDPELVAVGHRKPSRGERALRALRRAAGASFGGLASFAVAFAAVQGLFWIGGAR